MPLKKPGDFFQTKEVVKIKEEIDQLVNPKLSSISDAFDNYKEKVNKFELLSGVIEDVQKELKDIKVEVYKKEELEETVIKSTLLLEKKIKELKEDVEKESKNVLNISSIKYRKLEEDIKRYHDKALFAIDNEFEKIEEGQKSYDSKLANLKAQIFKPDGIEDLKKLNEKVEKDLIEFQEDLAEFQKIDYDISGKIKQIEEMFVKFNEQKVLNENVITEPPSTNNDDPLTPLDQKFVTFEQLSEHYRIFINRIQQQLSTLGGGGAVRIQDMDDIDLSTAKVDNKFLKYDSATNKWVGSDASGGAGTVNIIDDTSPQLGGNLDLNSKNITGTGNIDITGTVTATDINSASDIKLKKNIKAIKNPISKIMEIEGVSFNWKSNNKPSLGVTADHLQNILPELVKEDDIKSVNYNGLVGLLIECVKNQQKQIDELKDQLNN
tara:strand:- start:3077 stop:4387 length:1311 start_codon:yes stop_codon:yes gene_type:complete